jgi:hypothetical protein
MGFLTSGLAGCLGGGGWLFFFACGGGGGGAGLGLVYLSPGPGGGEAARPNALEGGGDPADGLIALNFCHTASLSAFRWS